MISRNTRKTSIPQSTHLAAIYTQTHRNDCLSFYLKFSRQGELRKTVKNWTLIHQGVSIPREVSMNSTKVMCDMELFP